MHDGGVAGVHVAAAERLRRRVRIVVVALHHDIPAHDDLADRLAVRRDVVHLLVDDADFA